MPAVPHPPGPRSALVGAAIAKRRQRLGISQYALADRSGMSQSIIAKIEVGRTNIRVEQLLDLAAALGVKPGSLLRDVA